MKKEKNSKLLIRLMSMQNVSLILIYLRMFEARISPNLNKVLWNLVPLLKHLTQHPKN